MLTKRQGDRVRMIRALLVDRYPRCFAAEGQAKRPLAIGIGERLALSLPEIGVMHLARALGDYTGGPTYLEHVVEGAARVDLEGDDDGAVTAQEADHAKARLAGLRHAWAKKDEKRRARQRATADEEG